MKIIILITGLFFAAVIPAFAQFGPQWALVAYYPLDSNANDVSGNNYHGTINNAVPTTDRFGVANKAYLFNGAARNNSIVATIGSLVPLGSSDRSIMAWAKWTGVGLINAAHIANYGQVSAGNACGVMVYGTNKWFTYGDRNPLGYDLNSNVVADTGWHHIAAVYESGIMNIYVDAQLQASRAIALNTLSGVLKIGARMDNSWDCYFDGKIDDVRIYKKALTGGEISAIYTQSGGNDPVPNSISGTQKTEQASTFPNPVHNFIHLKNVTEESDVTITDLSGRQVLKIIYKKEAIDLSQLSNGFYIITIQNKSGISVAKFTKE